MIVFPRAKGHTHKGEQITLGGEEGGNVIHCLLILIQWFLRQRPKQYNTELIIPVNPEVCLEVLAPSLPAGVSPLVWQNLGNSFPLFWLVFEKKIMGLLD